MTRRSDVHQHEIDTEKHWNTDEKKSHLLFEDPVGRILTAKGRVFSDSVFCKRS